MPQQFKSSWTEKGRSDSGWLLLSWPSKDRQEYDQVLGILAKLGVWSQTPSW